MEINFGNLNRPEDYKQKSAFYRGQYEIMIIWVLFSEWVRLTAPYAYRDQPDSRADVDKIMELETGIDYTVGPHGQRQKGEHQKYWRR